MAELQQEDAPAPGQQQGSIRAAATYVAGGVIDFFSGSKDQDPHGHGGKQVRSSSESEEWDLVSDPEIMPDESSRDLNQDDPTHVQCVQVIKSKEDEIRKLKDAYRMFKGSMDDQAGTIARLTKQNEGLTKEARKRDNEKARLLQEAREQELKFTLEISKLKDQLRSKESVILTMHQEALERDLNFKAEVSKLKQQVSADGSKIGQLKEHVKEQSQTVVKLREKTDLLEMVSTDKDSYGDQLQDVEDDRDKLTEDFSSARREIETLKRKIQDLGQELFLSKKETMRFYELQSLSDCRNSQCKEVRAKFNLSVSESNMLKNKVSSLEKVMKSFKGKITELEGAKNETMGEIAVVKAEAEIYKADFLEERRDREKAQGDLEEMRKEKGGQDTVFHEEVAGLQNQIIRLKKDLAELKKGSARIEAQLRDELNNSKIVLADFKDQIEKLSREKDDFKHEVERRKKSKHDKIKEYDKMKDQLRRSVDTTVDLTNQLDRAKREKKGLQKNVKKKDKAQSKALGSLPQSKCVGEARQGNAEQLYEEERERNKFEIESLQDDIKHYMSVIATLKAIIGGEEVLALSPAESERTLSSPMTDTQGTLVTNISDDDPFTNNPHYLTSEPELPLSEHLRKGYAAVKHKGSYSSSQCDAGTGAFLSNEQSNTTLQAPLSQCMDHGDAVNNKRSSQRLKQKEIERKREEVDQHRERSSAQPSSCLGGEPPLRAGGQGAFPPSQPHQEQFFREERPQPNAGDQQRFVPTLLPQGEGRPQPPGVDQLGFTPLQPPQDQIPREGRPQPHSGGRSGGYAPPHPPQEQIPREGRPQPHSGGRAGGYAPSQPQILREGRPQPHSGGCDSPQPSQEQIPREGRSQPISGGRAGEYAPTHPPPHPPQEQTPREGRPQPYSGGRAGGYPPTRPPQEQIPKEGPYSVGHAGGYAPPQPSQEQIPREGRRQELLKRGSDSGLPLNANLDHQYTPASQPVDNKLRKNDNDAHQYAATTPSVATPYSQEPVVILPGGMPKPVATQTSVPGQQTLATQTSSNGSKPPPSKELNLSGTENVLVKGIDNEIVEMAATVQGQVSVENPQWTMAMETPLDPNLVCPMCGDGFRIGEIQKFRLHVDQCDGAEM